MARWTASAKWAAGPALDGQRDMPLAFRLSEGLGITGCDERSFLLKWFDVELDAVEQLHATLARAAADHDCVASGVYA